MVYKDILHYVSERLKITWQTDLQIYTHTCRKRKVNF